MSKYGKQQQRLHERDAQRQIDEASAREIWKRPEDEEYEQLDFDPMPLDETFQVSQREVRVVRSGMLVEFAVTLTRADTGFEVLCIDTCNHGSVHRHRDGHGDPEEILWIDSASDIQAGLMMALDEIYATYEEARGQA